MAIWARCPTESFSISEAIIQNPGVTDGGFCSLSITIASTVRCSADFHSPTGYFPDTEYQGHLYQYIRAEGAALSNTFSNGGADKWFLIQMSVRVSSASYAVNVVSLGSTTFGYNITGLWWEDYGGGNGQWHSDLLPIGMFGSWPIGFGGTINFPSYFGKKIDFGDVYVWTNNYIDFTNSTNRTRFIRVVGPLAYPADPSVPIGVFGTPAIHFRGKASDNSFFFNRGNLGSFSKIGTAADFTPAPSY